MPAEHSHGGAEVMEVPQSQAREGSNGYVGRQALPTDTTEAVDKESATWSEDSESVAQWPPGLPVAAFPL